MNVNGISAPLPPQRPIAAPTARPAAEGAPGAAAQAGGEAAPTLWDLLTAEEREFFAQQSAIGQLTYRPGAASREAAPGPTGQRIDVRG
jgi:hypothetical protein